MEPDAIAAIRENADATHEAAAASLALRQALVDNQDEARALEEKRWNQQMHRDRRFGIALAVLAVALAVLMWQNRADANAREAAIRSREEATRLAEQQQRCEADLIANALGRARTQPVADPGAMARLREDLVLSRTNDVAVLIRVRDQVQAILTQVPTDDPILHIRELCFTGRPSDDPVSGKPGG